MVAILQHILCNRLSEISGSAQHFKIVSCGSNLHVEHSAVNRVVVGKVQLGEPNNPLSTVGGFGGKLRSGALADAGGGISILGNSDLGVNLNINELLNVMNSSILIVRNADVYSEDGFIVAANEIRTDDPYSDSADDLVVKIVGESTVYVANAISADGNVKHLNDRFYYNRRFGDETGDTDQDDGGFIVRYGLPRYTGIKPADYAAESFGGYTFAYWVYDQEGTQIASVDCDFWYITIFHN